MACNTNKQQCDLNSVFAAVANTSCGQFFNPQNFQAEQMIYDASFRDLINNYGIPVDYYINTFNLSAADTLYGEHPTSIFYGPVTLMMYIELTENAINLTKFGFASDDELTGYVHIQTFNDVMDLKKFYIKTAANDFLTLDEYANSLQTESGRNILTEQLNILLADESNKETFKLIGSSNRTLYNKYINNGQSIEPKSGDLIQVSPLGCDRPNGRGAKIFEVTERTDQDIASINPLLGHYVYRLRAKRYEHSFEPGAPTEPQNQQVYENSFSGKLSSNIPNEAQTEDKSYPDDIDNTSKSTVFDMSVNNTDIYGSYY